MQKPPMTILQHLIFWKYFKKYLEILFADFIDVDAYRNVPEEFLLNHMAGSFVEMVKWWMKRDMKPEPEVMTGYFMTVIKYA